MQAIKASKIKRRRAFWENALGVLTGVTVFVLAGAAHDRGIAYKWATALFGTLFSFGLVVFLRRKTLSWPFWVAIAICLVVHSVLVLAVFQYVLADFRKVSPLLWLPVMLIEVVPLLIAIRRIEVKLTGRHDTIKLSF